MMRPNFRLSSAKKLLNLILCFFTLVSIRGSLRHAGAMHWIWGWNPNFKGCHGKNCQICGTSCRKYFQFRCARWSSSVGGYVNIYMFFFVKISCTDYQKSTSRQRFTLYFHFWHAFSLSYYGRYFIIRPYFCWKLNLHIDLFLLNMPHDKIFQKLFKFWKCIIKFIKKTRIWICNAFSVKKSSKKNFYILEKGQILLHRP